MSNSYDDQSVLVKFRAVAKALAREIEKAVTTAAIEPERSAEKSLIVCQILCKVSYFGL